MQKIDEYVKCPYYRYDEGQAVHCEGVEAGCGLRLGFAKWEQKHRYKAAFCRRGWPECRVAEMLNRKYEYVP